MNEQTPEQRKSEEPVESPAVADTEPLVVEPSAEKPSVEIEVVEKLAPRPHWITICLGLVSPCLAGLALVMSIKSLNTSRDSLRISQRAYIHADSDLRRIIGMRGMWKLKIVFKNTGNTPGQITEAIAKTFDRSGCEGNPDIVFERWENDPEAMEVESRKPISPCEPSTPDYLDNPLVSGKDSASVDVIAIVSPQMKKTPMPLIVYPAIDVQFKYLDVFGVKHEGRSVCSIGLIGEEFTSDCTNVQSFDN